MRLTSRPAGLATAALLALALAPLSSSAAGVPKAFGYEGRLMREGAAATGVLTVHFSVFGSAEGGSVLWDEEQKVAVTDGFYATFLGSVVPLRNDTFDGSERYLELTVDGEVLAPRQRVGSVGYALRADVAGSVAGGTVDATSISVNGHTVIDATGHLGAGTGYVAGSGIVIDPATNTISLPSTCATNQVLKWNGSGWLCGAPGATYVAGQGLELNAGVFSLVSGCSPGQLLKWDGTSWACAGDLNSRVTVADGSGLELTGTALALSSQCAAGQLLKFDGTRWSCAADNNTGSLTAVTATAPLVAATTGGSVALTVPPATATASGYLSATDWVRFDAGQKLQGNAVAVNAPATGQVLKWDGSAWAPGADLDTNSGGTVTSVAVTAGTPLTVANATSTPTLTMTAATSVSPGYLTAADWATFNAKVGTTSGAGGDLTGTLANATVAKLANVPLAATVPTTGQFLTYNGTAWVPGNEAGVGTVTSVAAAGGIPLTVTNNASTPIISMTAASAGAPGYLTAADWTTFNAKLGAASAAGGDATGTLSALTVGQLQGRPVGAIAPASGQVLKWNGAAWTPSADLDTNSGGTVTSVAIAAGTPLTVASATSTPTLTMTAASSVSPGYLLAADWTAFNAKGAVSGVTGVAPVTVGGTAAAPVVSLAPATGSADGYLTSTDWSAFNGKLGASSSAGGDVAGTFGALTVGKLQGKPVSAAAPGMNQVLRWNGTSWAGSSDTSGTVTGVTAGTGLSGGTITGAGTIALADTAVVPGAYGSATTVPSLTVDAQGRLTAVTAVTLSGVAPGGAAAGDLAGTYPGPTVARLQGSAVSATAPAFNQVLRWNGTSWAGSADTSGTVTSVAAGAGLTGGTITGAGTLALANTAVTPGAYGSATTVPNITVDPQGRLTAASSVTISGVTPGGAAAGDLAGTYPNPTISKLQNVPVAASAPTAGQSLLFDGTSWVPGNITTNGTTRKYTVALIMKSSATCPAGFTSENLTDLAGVSGNMYMEFGRSGYYVGGSASFTFSNGAEERLYASVAPSTGAGKVCTRVYNTRGKPHVSFIGATAAASAACPADYNVLNVNDLRGTNGYAYAMANGGGFLLGYIDGWDYSSSAFQGGYQWRYWANSLAGNINTACFKVMGVEEDPATKYGVFPVVFGLKSNTQCPAGFTYTDTNNLMGANAYSYISTTDNASFWGGMYTWGYGGENYQYEYWTNAESIHYCSKFYALTGPSDAFVTIRGQNSSTCPVGYTGVDIGMMNGYNANGYIQKTHTSFYMGGLEGWGRISYGGGAIANNITAATVSRTCVKIDNAN